MNTSLSEGACNLTNDVRKSSLESLENSDWDLKLTNEILYKAVMLDY